jgi:hypothetical protein
MRRRATRSFTLRRYLHDQWGAAVVPRVHVRKYDLYMLYKGPPTYLLTAYYSTTLSVNPPHTILCPPRVKALGPTADTWNISTVAYYLESSGTDFFSCGNLSTKLNRLAAVSRDVRTSGRTHPVPERGGAKLLQSARTYPASAMSVPREPPLPYSGGTRRIENVGQQTSVSQGSLSKGPPADNIT